MTQVTSTACQYQPLECSLTEIFIAPKHQFCSTNLTSGHKLQRHCLRQHQANMLEITTQMRQARLKLYANLVGNGSHRVDVVFYHHQSPLCVEMRWEWALCASFCFCLPLAESSPPPWLVQTPPTIVPMTFIAYIPRRISSGMPKTSYGVRCSKYCKRVHHCCKIAPNI